MILDQYDTFIDKGFQIFKDSFPENKPTKTVLVYSKFVDLMVNYKTEEL
jgi:hypothetical protein